MVLVRINQPIPSEEWPILSISLYKDGQVTDGFLLFPCFLSLNNTQLVHSVFIPGWTVLLCVNKIHNEIFKILKYLFS